MVEDGIHGGWVCDLILQLNILIQAKPQILALIKPQWLSYDLACRINKPANVLPSDCTKALAECEFTTTVRKANRIFYCNYSGSPKSVSASDSVLRVEWLPTIIFLALGLSIPFASFPYEKLLLLGILIVVEVLLVSAALLAFLVKHNDNNQIEQSIEDVRGYFQHVNQRFALQGKRIEWLCPSEFIYLKVVFTMASPHDWRLLLARIRIDDGIILRQIRPTPHSLLLGFALSPAICCSARAPPQLCLAVPPVCSCSS